MKKQLLYTFAFLSAIFVVSAQSNTLTFTGSVDADQTFSFGSSAGVYALSGTDFSQSNTFLQHTSEVMSPNSISESFSINTDGSNVNATLTFRYRKAAASTVSGVISVAGQTDFAFTLGDSSVEDGGDDVANVNKFFDYTTTIPLSTTATNVIFTVNEFLNNTATLTRLRLYSVQVNGIVSLSTNDFDTRKINIIAYPNPAKNSFQIDSNINNIESVKLYTMRGRLIKTFNNEVNYDISDLATGIYIANINTQLGSKTLKIIKK